MHAATNALSAKNVRIHGMSSAKWTTRDKIIQFKGLVNLYKRDRAISEADATVAGKKQQKGLVDLRKTIEKHRAELDNAIGGDKQKIRNILADHKGMRLAYQNAESKNVIESVSQINFTKRKVLDKLKYHLKLKSQELIDLKLEEALLEDRLKYSGYGQLEDERMAQIITGKVQDALLKKEGALAIQQSYAQIIDVMKKDALYFDGILLTIQNDYWYQCRCVLNAAKQGQLATEYKDDRAKEFALLEEAVLSDMRKQKANLAKVRERLEATASNMKHLLRRDSDLTLCVSKLEDTQEMVELQKDLSKIETTLEVLSAATLVTSFEAIYPSLQEQMRQKIRLTELAAKCERNHEIIMNKLDHAQMMSHVLENTMVETTGDYVKRKVELLGLHADEEKAQEELDINIKTKNLIIAKVRMGLRQLQQITNIAKPQTSPRKNQFQDELVVPEVDETDGCKIIETLVPILTQLVAKVHEKLDDSNVDEAYKMYEMMMVEHCIPLEAEVQRAEGVLGDFVMEATNILTREDIKRQSKEIVDANSKEDDVVIPNPPPKKK